MGRRNRREGVGSKRRKTSGREDTEREEVSVLMGSSYWKVA